MTWRMRTRTTITIGDNGARRQPLRVEAPASRASEGVYALSKRHSQLHARPPCGDQHQEIAEAHHAVLVQVLAAAGARTPRGEELEQILDVDGPVLVDVGAARGAPTTETS